MGITSSPELGRLLRRQREDAGLSLRDLERLTKIPYSTLYKLEDGAGVLEPDRLQRIARALGSTIEDYYAAAGFTPGEHLPEISPYLRAKYGLPEDAVRELDNYFNDMKNRYGLTERKEEPDERNNRTTEG